MGETKPSARNRWIWIVAASLLWCWWHNRGFMRGPQLVGSKPMNDVDSIIWGYEATPNLLVDGLRWWYGTWIQVGIEAWRPFSSYLYWIDCWLADHYGRVLWGWVGWALLVVETWVAVWLTWRLTRWRPSAVLAGLLLPLIGRFNYGQPPYWLYWFPVHQEILTATVIMATLAAFDVWLEKGTRRTALGFVAMLLVAYATKETAFILPGLLTCMALFRRYPESPVTRGRALGMVAVSVMLVVAVWLWRAACIANPRNPSIKLVQIPRKMGLFLLCPVFRHGLGGEWGTPLIPLWITLLATWWRRRQPRPLLFWAVAAVVIVVPLNVFHKGFDDVLLSLVQRGTIRTDFAQIFVIIGSLALLWRYRRDEPTLAVLGCLICIYVPNIDYIGWHYDVVPWGIRVVTWGLLLKLAWRYLSVEGHGARLAGLVGKAGHRLAHQTRITPE